METYSDRTQISFLREVARESKHGAAFRNFHDENPDVYDELVRLLEQAWNAGRERIGMGMLFEVLRWNRSIGSCTEEFKLNNNYRAYYTRMIKRMEPRLGALITSRVSMADADIGEIDR